jgi:hypothetical protein
MAVPFVNAITSKMLPRRYCLVEIADAQGNFLNFENKNSVGPRIDFDVTRKTQSFHNGFSTAEIKLYNLNFKSFKFLRDQGRQITVTAGHEHTLEDNKGKIFEGYVYSVKRTKIDTDIIVILYCSTLDPGNQKLRKVNSYSFQEIKLKALIDKIATSAGLSASMSEPSQFNAVIINRAYQCTGLELLNELAAEYRFTFEIIKNTLKILKIGSTSVNSFEFNRSKGLLKPPVITEKGVDIEVFLTPNIGPQDIFNLKAEFANFNLGALEFQDRLASKLNIGFVKEIQDTDYTLYYGKYHVLFLVHTGSTHTNTWQTRIEGTSA